MATIDEVNDWDPATFVNRLGHVFEDRPELAAAAATDRPFANRDELVAAFHHAAERLDRDERLALLRAHPMLGRRAPMAAASVAEQTAAGFTTLAEDRASALAAANEQYAERFGFPYIVAVAGRSADELFDLLHERLERPAEVEFDEAFRQVLRIAQLRIEQDVS